MPADIQAIFELSPQQQGMLFESLRQSGSDVFIEQEVFTLPGTLDPDRLLDAWGRLLARHAGLRSSFVWKNRAEPLQVVFASIEPRIRFEDWRGQSRYAQERRLAEFLTAERSEGFDLTVPPLIRIAVIRMAEASSRVVLTQHHILLDGWSRAILLEEFAAAYAGTLTGDPPQSYASYVDWLKLQDHAAIERFWREMMRGFTAATPLAGRGSAIFTGERYGEVDGVLSPSEARRIAGVAREHRVTIASVLHGAWALLLSRSSGRRDVMFGTTVSGRPPELPGLDRTFGLFINTVPFRIDVDPAMDLWAWLGRVQERLIEIRRFELASAGQIHGWSEVAASAPLYETLLVVENYPFRKSETPSGAEARTIGARTAYPLTLLAAAHDALELRAVHDTRRLAHADAVRMVEHLRLVLRRLGSGRDSTVAEVVSGVPSSTISRAQSSQPASRRAEPHIPPSTPLEMKLVAIATELLGIDVGMTDRFFDLGGHSLVATQFLSRVRRAFQIEVPMRVLFDSRDMRAFASSIEEALVEKVASLSESEAQLLMEQLG